MAIIEAIREQISSLQVPSVVWVLCAKQPRFGCVEIAEVFASLMTDVLGYSRLAAQGRKKEIGA
jgi:hypothetical protein